MSKYRDREPEYVTVGEVRENMAYDDAEELMNESDYKQILDGIESDVKEIERLLESIEGLTEVDEVKLLVEKLLEDLY